MWIDFWGHDRVTGRGSRCSGDYLIAFAVFYVRAVSGKKLHLLTVYRPKVARPSRDGAADHGNCNSRSSISSSQRVSPPEPENFVGFRALRAPIALFLVLFCWLPGLVHAPIGRDCEDIATSSMCLVHPSLPFRKWPTDSDNTSVMALQNTLLYSSGSTPTGGS